MASRVDIKSSLLPGDAFAALRHRNYRLFFTGQFISMCGTWLQNVAQQWLVWHLTSRPDLVGVVAACNTLPMFLFSIPGGALADRVDRRRLLLVTQTLAMILAAALGWLSLLPGLQFWHVAVVSAASGAVAAFDVPTRQAFVVEMVEREALSNAIALNSMLFNGARIFGPAMAAALIAIKGIGIPGCFFLNSASYIAALIALWRIRVARNQQRVDDAETPLSAAIGGIRYVWETRVVRRLIIMLLAVGVFGWSLGVLYPTIAERLLQGDASTFGWLNVANGIGAVVGAFILASLADSPHRRKLVYGGLLVYCLSMLLLSYSHWLPLSLLALAGAGGGNILFSATSNTVVQGMVPDELRGRVMGVWALVFAGSAPIGNLQAGWVGQHLGAPAAIQIGVTAMAITGVVVFWGSQRERAAQALKATGS